VTSEILAKAITISRGKGIVKFFRPILDRMPSFIFESNNHVWFVKSFDEIPEIEPRISITLNVTREEFEETFNWIKRNGRLWGLWEKEKEVAVQEGHYWINAKHNRNIVGFMKIGFGKVFISDYRKTIRFPKNVIFTYESYVDPRFRGNRIQPYIRSEVCKFFKRKGFTKNVSYIHDWNTPSIRAATHFGMKKAKTIYYYRILGFKVLTDSPENL
jgi:GNAT superfamily N-acetyltransferase